MGRYKIPKLADWNDFEDLCCQIWKNIWDDSNVQRFGRSGQRQNGVDIAFLSKNGEMNGIQCKNVEKLTYKGIDDEIKKAQKFEPKLDSFTFATSFDRDVKLTSYVLKKSQENIKKGLFKINIWFWDDICDELIKNRDLTKRFFPEFFEDENLISTILDNTLDCFEDFNYYDVINNLKLLSLNFEEFSQENKYKFLILEIKITLSVFVANAANDLLQCGIADCINSLLSQRNAVGIGHGNDDEADLLKEIAQQMSLIPDRIIIFQIILQLTHDDKAVDVLARVHAGGDDDHIGIHGILVITCNDGNRLTEAGALDDVHDLAFHLLLVDVDEDDLGGDVAEGQGVSDGSAHVTGADDGDLSAHKETPF